MIGLIDMDDGLTEEKNKSRIPERSSEEKKTDGTAYAPPGEQETAGLSLIAADAAALSFLEKNGTSLPDLFTRDLLLMHTMINGAMHVEDIHALAKMLAAGDQVKLVLEPDNPVDPQAILVRDIYDRKLGYIPRKKNEVLFHLMDAGKYLYGVVSGGDIGDNLDEHDNWVEIYIDVYMKD